ncbi:hypothetical protein [Umezawaea sp. NPDC059074]|uniref:hypothetical protein n=1 Tax=Umezawaea sp. NPDC059074 TaxID=3346716 RepID=UPI003674B896
MTSMLFFVGRRVIRRTVRGRVRFSTITFQQVHVLQVRFPVLPAEFHPAWQDLMADTRLRVSTGLADLLASLFAPTPTPAPTPALPPGRQRVNSKQLLPADLKVLLLNPGDWVTHRTDHEGVGTCQTALRTETDIVRKKNPAAPFGVYAAIGIVGLADYGPYGVVFPRYTNRVWQVKDAPAVLCAVQSLDVDEAEGWYTAEDLAEARRT